LRASNIRSRIWGAREQWERTQAEQRLRQLNRSRRFIGPGRGTGGAGRTAD
jgi:hypothetical protein